MSANERQVAGGHYQKQKIQHWDYVHANNLDYFQGQITKYVSRHKDKNGIEDLRKAQHFLEKYIELLTVESSLESKTTTEHEWHEWDGSREWPKYASLHSMVRVWFRNGVVSETQQVRNLRWEHLDGPNDIIQYQVVVP